MIISVIGKPLEHSVKQPHMSANGSDRDNMLWVTATSVKKKKITKITFQTRQFRNANNLRQFLLTLVLDGSQNKKNTQKYKLRDLENKF